MGENSKLTGLDDKLSELIAEIRAISMETHTPPKPQREMKNPQTAQSRAKDIYNFRRKRERFFDTDLFGEPGWDMLLDLYEHAERGKAVSVSSACIAASVPPTTALRWIAVLVQRGLVDSFNDPLDRRRRFLNLSVEARSSMQRLLDMP